MTEPSPEEITLMSLAGLQIEHLQRALLSAFRRRELETLVHTRLGVRLPTVAGGETANDSDVVYQLITWAESNGRTQNLILSAAACNPSNPDLVAFLIEYMPTQSDPAVRYELAVQLGQSRRDEAFEALYEAAQYETNLLARLGILDGLTQAGVQHDLPLIVHD